MSSNLRQRGDYPPCPRPHHYRLPDGRHFIDREGQARDRERAAARYPHAPSRDTDGHAIVIPRTEPEDGFTQFAQSTGLLEHLRQDAEGNHLVVTGLEREALEDGVIQYMNRQMEEALRLDEEAQSCAHHLPLSHLNGLPTDANASDVNDPGASSHSFRVRRAGNDAAADVLPNGHTHTSPPDSSPKVRQETVEDIVVPNIDRYRNSLRGRSDLELSRQHQNTMSGLRATLYVLGTYLEVREDCYWRTRSTNVLRLVETQHQLDRAGVIFEEAFGRLAAGGAGQADTEGRAQGEASALGNIDEW